MTFMVFSLHLHKTAGRPGFPAVWMAVSVLAHDKNGTKSGQDTRLPEGKMIRYSGCVPAHVCQIWLLS